MHRKCPNGKYFSFQMEVRKVINYSSIRDTKPLMEEALQISAKHLHTEHAKSFTIKLCLIKLPVLTTNWWASITTRLFCKPAECSLSGTTTLHPLLISASFLPRTAMMQTIKTRDIVVLTLLRFQKAAAAAGLITKRKWKIGSLTPVSWCFYPLKRCDYT